METLQEIGIKYKTDKVEHEFLPFYECIIQPYKDTILNVLEIGIGKSGAAHLMWREYFNNVHTTIYGIDHVIRDEAINNITQKGILFAQCNQESTDELVQIFKDVVFDLIVDDGGHTMKQQQLSLYNLTQRMSENGIYIIEDLHTSYFKNFNKENKKTTLNLLNNLILLKDCTGIDEDIDTIFSNYHLSVKEILDLRKKIKNITIFSGRRGITSILRLN